jgi:hypothetical protein
MTVDAPTRTRWVMPFFDRKSDKAAYVLISFSRNFTARRLDSSITCLRFGTHTLTACRSGPVDNQAVVFEEMIIYVSSLR